MALEEDKLGASVFLSLLIKISKNVCNSNIKNLCNIVFLPCIELDLFLVIVNELFLLINLNIIELVLLLNQNARRFYRYIYKGLCFFYVCLSGRICFQT